MMKFNDSTDIISASGRELPFKTALAYLKSIHDLEMEENDFEEVGLLAWKKIGNREKTTYLLLNQELKESSKTLPNGDTKYFGRYDLPCNVYSVDAVTIDFTSCDKSSYITEGLSYNRFNSYYVNRLSAKSNLTSEQDLRGEYIFFNVRNDGFQKYVEVDADIQKINLIYTGLKLDDEGLPLLSEKEALAISYFCAQILEHRRVLKKQGDGNLLQYLKAETDRHIRDSRVQEKYTQNHLDSLLNVKVSLNRKWYNRGLRIYKDV